MPYISKIKLPGSSNVYEIVDRKGRAMIAGDFSTSTAYAVGDYVIYNDKLYQFSSAHPAGAWDSDDVIETTTTDEIKALKNTISGGVHFIGTTTTPIYDRATTSPITMVGGASVVPMQGDLVILDVVHAVPAPTSYQVNVALNKDTYYLHNAKYYFCTANVTAANNTSWDAIEQYMDKIYESTNWYLEFLFDGNYWNAFGSANAFGELAFKDKVSGTYTKPTGSGTVTVNDYTENRSRLEVTSITGVAGTTSASKMSAGTAIEVAKVGTAVRYGTADVGTAVTYGTANKASSATTVGNANVGNAVAVATQGDTFYYGTADVGTAVTVATAGTPVVYGTADVGTAVTYGNANVGSTISSIALATGATKNVAIEGVIVSMGVASGEEETLIIATASTNSINLVTDTTSVVQAATSNTTLTPAKAADTTRKLTPVGGTTSITPAKSAGQTHSAVGVGGTTNITPAVTSTTTIYGAVDSTSTLTPAVAAPNTQTIVPAVSNGTITPWTETAITVATAAASPTTVATGGFGDSSSSGAWVTSSITATASTKTVTVGTTTDTLVSK